MFMKVAMRTQAPAANKLCTADLDAVVGGINAAPAPHQSAPTNNPNLLVVIAIIAILIG